MTGDTPVSASFTVTGSCPGVSKLNFYLDSNPLLADYEAPYTFVLPSDTFVDGTAVLEVEAVMRMARSAWTQHPRGGVPLHQHRRLVA